MVFLAGLLAACGERKPEARASEGARVSEEAEAPKMEAATCEETAVSTMDMAVCWNLKNEALADSTRRVLEAWKKDAPDGLGPLADKVAKAFEPFAEEEHQRLAWSYIDGSATQTAGGYQELRLRRDFAARIAGMLERGLLPPAAPRELDSFDLELNRAYAGDLALFANGQRELAGEGRDAETREDNIREYNRHARDAQRHWIRYRDAWAELAAARFTRNETFDPAVSLRALLTRERILQMCEENGDPPVHCPCWVPDRDYGEGCPSKDEPEE